MNPKGWRVFDVAINNKTVIKDLDIWSEVGNRALKKVVDVHVTGGQLTISFPNSKVGQAVIAAIAIATKDMKVKPAEPSPPLIKTDVSFYGERIARSWLNTGDYQYIGSNYTFVTLPPVLYGAEWLRMPDDRAANVGPYFTVTADADIFIALDSSMQQLPWMKGYEDTKMVLQSTLDGKVFTFKLYRKRYTANSQVELGKNTGNIMYSVFALPVTTLQPPFDQKPTTSIKMPQATTNSEGNERRSVNNRESVVFTKPAGGQIDFTITPGVADVYSITFRYSNAGTETRKGQWQLIQADGTVMKTEPIEFTNTREGKWNYFTTTTGSMINAGKYTVRITATDAEGVAIGGLDVQ
jgi:hypothetical protein